MTECDNLLKNLRRCMIKKDLKNRILDYILSHSYRKTRGRQTIDIKTTYWIALCVIFGKKYQCNYREATFEYEPTLDAYRVYKYGDLVLTLFPELKAF
jgi:hypothetical protein